MSDGAKIQTQIFWITAQVASTVFVHLSGFLGSLIMMDVGSSLDWWEQHSHGVGHLDPISYLLTGDLGHGTSTLWPSASPDQIIRPPHQGGCKDSEAIKVKRTTQSIYFWWQDCHQKSKTMKWFCFFFPLLVDHSLLFPGFLCALGSHFYLNFWNTFAHSLLFSFPLVSTYF